VLDTFFTVRQALEIHAGYYGVPQSKRRTDHIIEAMGLTDKADANMRALSGGMKRRVMVAQALVHRPPVIVLDEPTAGVDVELRQSLWSFVRELNQAGHTIVLTTHYLEEAQALCNRIAMLKKGRLIALEPIDTLLAHSAQREVALKLAGPLPEALRPWLRSVEDDVVTLQLPEIAKLEQVLAVLREARIEIRELSVIETDLESVFVKMMNGGA